jgi:hypothetical protein
MSIHSVEAVIEEGSVNSESSSEELTVPIDFDQYTKELQVSSALQSLLDEHKEQSKVVQGIKDEISSLEREPFLFFQNRKKLLYHAYSQSLKDYEGEIEWNVQVIYLFSILTVA